MNQKIFLRFIEEEDLEYLYKWRNDEVTRKFAFNAAEISFKEHFQWFNQSISNPKRNIFIAINEKGEKIGQIRFDKKDGFTEIDIIISPDYRHQGYGIKTIKKGCRMFFNNFEVDYIVAKIKKDNLPSIKAFEKVGFKKYKKRQDRFELRLNKNEQI